MNTILKMIYTLKKVRLFLTKLHLRLLGSKFLRTSTVTLPDGRDIEVIVFSRKKRAMLGLTNIIGAIAIDERCYRTINILNFVVAHEAEHQRSWYSYFLMPVIAASGVYGLFTLCYAFGVLLALSLERNPTYMQVFSHLLISGLVLIFIACICSWFIEYKADYKAIKLLGVQVVLQARKEISELLPKLPLSWRIYSAMTHPPITFTIRICRFFNRDRCKNLLG